MTAKGIVVNDQLDNPLIKMPEISLNNLNKLIPTNFKGRLSC
jgi:hypothetical protein